VSFDRQFPGIYPVNAAQQKLGQVLRDCPRWVHWVAQDADGTWWGYEAQPLPHDTGWYENEVGRCIRLLQDHPDPAWPDSLQQRTPRP
jgi:hypothetical protein